MALVTHNRKPLFGSLSNVFRAVSASLWQLRQCVCVCVCVCVNVCVCVCVQAFFEIALAEDRDTIFCLQTVESGARPTRQLGCHFRHVETR